jgi:hypothetical protein
LDGSEKLKFLSTYWPSNEEIFHCIKRDAEAASDAVILAVHQESLLLKREAGSNIETPASESELLDEFLKKELPEGILILSITGISGVGKSHMVRWLSAQLGRDPRAKNMHVIRIPKSSSLRTVVDLILEPLSGNKRYEEARVQLREAVSAVSPRDGAIRFVAEIEVELQKLVDRLTVEIKDDPSASELKFQLHHAKNLPQYFSDAALQNHFKGKVLPKIIQRALSGKSDDGTDEESLPQFSVEDLRPGDSNDVGNAAREVQTYYKTILNKSGGRGFEQAVDVLNSVVDSAIRNVFSLDKAMGGATIEEIITSIRELLMEEGKELVLLIEDFATLSGIQQVLLDVIIKDAIYDGKQVLAPMRTALAVTDGYLPGRQTILTRAEREWVIQSSLETEDEVFNRTVNLVGAYLNAARWGKDVLMSKYQEKLRSKESTSLTDWITVYQDENETTEDSDLKSAFGASDSGVPLFPYNRQAIASLASTALKVGGRLEFNPRSIIVSMIHRILNQRSSFENSTFPSSTFRNVTLKQDLADWLSRTELNSTDRDKMEQVIYHWGGNPEGREKIGEIPGEIFEAFGLPRPKTLGIEETPINRDRKKIKQPEKDKGTNPDLEPDDPRISEWKTALDNWVGGANLNLQRANFLRNVIIAPLNRAIDWNAYCMKPIAASQTIIELPNAAGNFPSAQKLVIAMDGKDSGGRLRRTLLAFIRLHYNNENLDYPDADEDTIHIANAIDKLVPKYIDIVLENIKDEIAGLVSALVVQGQILGISPKNTSSDLALNQAVFSEAAVIDYKQTVLNPVVDPWMELRISAATVRPTLQGLLKERIAAFQGTGSTVLAIDANRLVRGEIAAISKNIKNLTEDQREHITNLQIRRIKGRTGDLRKYIAKFHSKLDDFSGENFDKNKFCSGLKSLIQIVESAKLWPRVDAPNKRKFLDDIENFRLQQIAGLVGSFTTFDFEPTNDEFETYLHSLGKINFSLVESVENFISKLFKFIEGVEVEVKREEGKYAGVSLADSISEINDVLSDISRTLNNLNGGSAK